ncbi:hypothetical protein L228DRAFT_141513 [Xylona heveae TC161]|uniref:Xylanolytic transcriptional activator regulatory domain-containing protein n=1 Tax=Xylona heveae (strain CBS 132557 / TC161) TaxID=1328760 RepID=A0A165H5M0_XYLHT|nr:hypothetical protein L228DRAFT_141513 [Xylona heveae TC161]KZF23018.1 hypothetical protein L228DRAFT_141513 [Xylona heveae TC161]
MPILPKVLKHLHFQPKLLSRHVRSTSERATAHPKGPFAPESELSSLLPRFEVAKLLVDNYFDRIHWFMLLFHQRDFRANFEILYSLPSTRPPGQNIATNNRVGQVAVLLAVCAISLQYTTDSQKQALARHGVDLQALQQRFLTALKQKLLDILSLGSLETVQTCVLLGSYYLYQGEPGLAWPLCGCGLRIAQALNLHRNLTNSASARQSDVQPSLAARKRGWWAVYEIETFCSMMYGFPLSISDSDCDVDELDPFDEYSGSTSQAQTSEQPTLLFFKCYMSKLSRIVKSALTDLYGTHRDLDRENHPIMSHNARLQSLIKKVQDLDSRLLQWREGVAAKLRPTTISDSGSNQARVSGHSDQNVDKTFEEHLFQLQALALKLAYENARILVHRPLLSYKTIIREGGSRQSAAPDPFQYSIEICRDAALQISRVGSVPNFKQVYDTYAVTFVSLHLFTAGVTLCIMASLDPLSREAHESKRGVRALMEMQGLLKPKSVAAGQGLDILRNLMSLVMAKEIDSMFEMEQPASVNETESANQSSVLNLPHQSADQHCERERQPGSQFRTATLPTQRECDMNSSEPDQNLLDAPLQLDMPFDCTNFDFCENPSITEALLDFEQVINYPPSDTVDDDTSSSHAGELPSGGFHVGQDQGWIWGWNYNA